MSAARQRSPRGEGDRLREELLDAASDMLVKTCSADAVSIRAVADRVGVTPPSIYRHFPDKNHLIWEVCARHFASLHEALGAATAGIEDPLDAIRAMARAYVRFGVANPEVYRVMFLGRPEDEPEDYADVVLAEDSAFGLLVRMVGRAVEAGRFRDDLRDPLELSIALWAPLHGLVCLAIAKPEMPGLRLDDQVELLLDYAVRGLAPSRDGTRP